METRVPLWQFSGLVLIMMAIGLGVYTNKAAREQQAQFLESPASGDVYEYKTKEGNYTLFKIADVRHDTVTVRFNNYEVNKISGLDQINKDENYSDTAYYIARASLMQMFASGDITDINRNQ